ncbi:NADH-quinone oxidoreductase subunit K [Marinospirillum sp.]|uniref:NADH-quinone oxidoreductase subunit K n=1 Tax=Marinospirillum sp. TaxID=2183934 RepID=UPI00286FEF8C|nr:NADH-quinone oxidoreductase subunit K [Marinospirillum sp.]MDR9467484.1 NADH-quinone oxidoreductase subunit K [Marinospirillum sp.]
MSEFYIYALTGGLLSSLGLLGFVFHQHLLRRLIAFNLMGSGCFLLLTGLSQSKQGVDPLPQALVLTGIVVAVAATALALVLIRRWYHLTGQTALPEDIQPLDSQHQKEPE